MKIDFDTTFKTQIEIFPRLTYIYGETLAFEWLWFCVWIDFLKKLPPRSFPNPEQSD